MEETRLDTVPEGTVAESTITEGTVAESTITEGDVPTFIPDTMRRQHENPLNLTQEQLDLKGEQIALLKVLYPDVDPFWADIICDICLTKTQKEIDEIKARVGPFKRDYSKLQTELNKVKEAYTYNDPEGFVSDAIPYSDPI